MADYRSRIYSQYLIGSKQVDVSNVKAELNCNSPYFKMVIRNFFPENKDIEIMDLGCGYGAFIYNILECGYSNVRGVDRSPPQVALARKMGIECVDEGDIMDTLQSLSENSFDIISTFDLIEHLTKDELFALSDHVFRVLKRGGVWLIHTPNAGSPFFGKVRYGDLTHLQAFTPESMQQFLCVTGFSEVSFHENTPIIHGIKSLIRWLLWKFIRMMLRLYLLAETGDAGNNVIFSQNFLTVVKK